MQGAGGVGGLLWAMDRGQTYAPGYDGNGNIIAWISASDGTLSGTREYGAFGENIASTGVGALDQWTGIPFGFSTKCQDRLTGHYYYGYRFYDTNAGRWLSRDPTQETGGLNLYAFVGNNGVNRWDLLGMIAIGFSSGVDPLDDYNNMKYVNKDSINGIQRDDWMAVVYWYLSPQGYRIAGHLFVHSLQDRPSDLFFGMGHYISLAIKDSVEFRNQVDKIANNAPIGFSKLKTESKFDSVKFSSNRDLFLGIHKAEFLYEGEICKLKKESYCLDIMVEIKDTYDFKFTISEYINNFRATAANNLAVVSQLTGAIAPYRWSALIREERNTIK